MKYLFIVGLVLSMAAIGLTIRCYVSESQLKNCSSIYNACSTMDIGGTIARSCTTSTMGGLGCKANEPCVCQEDGCNGPTGSKTTTLATTENGSIKSGAQKAIIVGSLIAVGVLLM